MKLFGHELFNWKKETDLKLYNFFHHGIIKYYNLSPVTELVRDVTSIKTYPEYLKEINHI